MLAVPAEQAAGREGKLWIGLRRLLKSAQQARGQRVVVGSEIAFENGGEHFGIACRQIAGLVEMSLRRREFAALVRRQAKI